ncbi:MAG: hypothetical protein K6F87_04755 [Lachnospiraceae bacterium]|nr:hypothetical protein [Lachnospiraceae bacterium]
MNQQIKKPSAAPTVLSVIALAFSALALLCVMSLVIVTKVGPESGSATALTWRAVFTVGGMIFFIGFTWILGIMGILAGLVMMIVDIATARKKILWIPILAVVVAIVSIVICCCLM